METDVSKLLLPNGSSCEFSSMCMSSWTGIREEGREVLDVSSSFGVVFPTGVR